VELQHHLRTSWKVKGERLSAPGAIEKEVQEFSTQHQVSRRGVLVKIHEAFVQRIEGVCVSNFLSAILPGSFSIKHFLDDL